LTIRAVYVNVKPLYVLKIIHLIIINAHVNVILHVLHIIILIHQIVHVFVYKRVAHQELFGVKVFVIVLRVIQSHVYLDLDGINGVVIVYANQFKIVALIKSMI
jgi:hypothetical protein